MNYYVPIAMIVVANVTYNICQKSTPHVLNPFVAMSATYVVALTSCLALYPFFPSQQGFFVELKQLNWASLVLGLAILLVELGFLFAYRVGWKIGVASLVGNLSVGLCLIPVALFLFKERLSLANVLGIVFAIVGLILMGKK